MLQVSRRVVQMLAVLLIVFLPIESFYARILSGKGQREVGEVAIDDEGKFMGSMYVFMDKVYDPHPNDPDAVKKLDEFKGGIWSLTLFGYNITDPLAGIVAIIGSRGIYMPLLISMFLPLVFIFIFGRAFCAWICPMNTLFEINNWVRNKVEKYLFQPADIQFNRNYKYIVLVISLLLTAAGISLLPYLLPYALVTRQPYYYIFYRTFGIGMGMILIMFLFEIFISRRGWCRYFCPGGAFYAILSGKRFVRVDRDPAICMEGCNICTRACKMGLLPHEDKTGMECDNCGLCVSACPSNAMKYKIEVRSQKSEVRSSIKTFLIAFALLLTPDSSLLTDVHAAHSKLINPHGQASEETGVHNFPQTPSEEHSAIVDGYLIHFSSFQFTEKRGLKVKSVVTVRDSNGNPYSGPLIMNIEELGLFGKVQESTHTFEKAFENRYPRFDWFTNDVRCKVVIYFTDNGKRVRVEFPLTVGSPLPSGVFLGSLGLMLGAVIGVVVYVNKKRAKDKFVPAG